MNNELSPIRERAAEIRGTESQIEGMLAQGSEKARAVAQDTIRETKALMGLA
jgi:hypothetical protein